MQASPTGGCRNRSGLRLPASGTSFGWICGDSVIPSSGRPDRSRRPVTFSARWRGSASAAVIWSVLPSVGGVAVEVALTRPSAVASLLLAAPGGSLLAEVTPDLQAFLDAEGAALNRGDLDAAVEANLSWWVEGPRRSALASPVPRCVNWSRACSGGRSELSVADWDDVEEKELQPPALDRLGEIEVPVLVLVGGLDLDAVQLPPRSSSPGPLVPGASTGRTSAISRRWSARPISSTCCGNG